MTNIGVSLAEQIAAIERLKNCYWRPSSFFAGSIWDQDWSISQDEKPRPKPSTYEAVCAALATLQALNKSSHD